MTGDNKFSLIDIGKLSKPINTLIERIGDATGVWYEPERIVRKARAEAEAMAIAVRAEIEVDELRSRALHRLASEEAKKQENIEAVMEAAIPDISGNADPQAVDKDWLSNFIDKVKTISDEDAQNIWGKILSGETNTPGSFSKKTVNLLHEMDKSDAEMFNTLMKFTWVSGGPLVLVFDITDRIYLDNGISFSMLEHLSSIGLVNFNNLSNYQSSGLSGRTAIRYCGNPLWLDFGTAPQNLELGRVFLTKSGKELARISQAEGVDGFYEYVAMKWKQWIVS